MLRRSSTSGNRRKSRTAAQLMKCLCISVLIQRNAISLLAMPPDSQVHRAGPTSLVEPRSGEADGCYHINTVDDFVADRSSKLNSVQQTSTSRPHPLE